MYVLNEASFFAFPENTNAQLQDPFELMVDSLLLLFLEGNGRQGGRDGNSKKVWTCRRRFLVENVTNFKALSVILFGRGCCSPR